MKVTGTLAGKEKWYKRHARMITIASLALVAILVLAVIVISVLSAEAASKHRKLIVDARYNVRKSLQEFSDTATALHVNTTAEAQSVRKDMAALRSKLNTLHIREPQQLPMAALLSEDMRTALKETHATNEAINTLMRGLDQLDAATEYQIHASEIIEKNILNTPLADEDSARRMAADWSAATDELKAVQPPKDFIEVHSHLMKAADSIASYCNEIADEYRNADYTALQDAQSGLNERFNAIRDVAESSDSAIETITGDISKQAAFFFD